MNYAGSIAIFGLGIIVGTAVGMLLAPKSGPSLREDLRERLRQLPEEFKSAVAGETADNTDFAGA